MRLHTLVVVLALEGIAAAGPRSGGTIGGGWSSSSSGATSWPGMSIPTGSGRTDNTTPSLPGVLVLLAAGTVIAVGFRMRPAPRSVPETTRRHDVRVATIRIVVDAIQRPTILSGLRSLGGFEDTRSLEGRAELVHEVTTLLRRAAPGWLYASIDAPTAAMTRHDARRELTTRVVDERARFDIDLVRNGFIAADADTPPVRGLAVITVVVATRGEALEVTTVDRTNITRALAWLANTLPTELVAANVIWCPAAGAEPFDSFALESAIRRRPSHAARQRPRRGCRVPALPELVRRRSRPLPHVRESAPP